MGHDEAEGGVEHVHADGTGALVAHHAQQAGDGDGALDVADGRAQVLLGQDQAQHAHQELRPHRPEAVLALPRRQPLVQRGQHRLGPHGTALGGEGGVHHVAGRQVHHLLQPHHHDIGHGLSGADAPPKPRCEVVLGGLPVHIPRRHEQADGPVGRELVFPVGGEGADEEGCAVGRGGSLRASCLTACAAVC